MPSRRELRDGELLVEMGLPGRLATCPWRPLCGITYLRSWNGFPYLAFMLDCFSRMIVGWQLATHMRAELVLDALELANGLRRPPEGFRGFALTIHCEDEEVDRRLAVSGARPAISRLRVWTRFPSCKSAAPFCEPYGVEKV